MAYYNIPNKRSNLIVPSFKNGYAHSSGESVAPNQWDNLVALYKPELGHQTSGLIDLVSGGKATPNNISSHLLTAFQHTNEGHALYLDGTDDWYEAPITDVTQFPGGNFTVMCWVKPTGAGTSTKTAIISNYKGGVGGFVILRNNTFDRWEVTVADSGGFTTQYSDTDDAAQDEWRHIVLAHDSNYIYLFQNGQEKVSRLATGGYAVSNRTLRIGGGWGAEVPGDFFEGYIQDIRLYNRTINTEAEIIEIMKDKYRIIEIETKNQLGPMTANITGSATVTANLNEKSYLDADITGSATVVADLVENLVTRVTQQVTEVLYHRQESKGRVTQHIIEILYKPSKKLVSSITASGLITADFDIDVLTVSISGSGVVTADLDVLSGQLSAAITGSGIIVADLDISYKFLSANLTGDAFVTGYYQETRDFSSAVTASGSLRGIIAGQDEPLVSVVTTSLQLQANLDLPTLRAGITGLGVLTGDITGKQQLTSSIVTSGILQGDITNFTLLTVAITGSAAVTANLRENTEYLAAAIVASGVSTANINVPQKPGHTLQLTQTVVGSDVFIRSLTDTLVLTSTFDLVFGARALSASDTLTLTDSVSVIRVLPTKTASNTLSLTDSAVPARLAESFLNLTHSVVGEIYFIPLDTFNLLNLTDLATENIVSNLSVESLLNLTDQAVANQIVEPNPSSTLLLNQLAVGTVLKSKTYILLQAPFEFIQTSIVLPNPLLDDTENLLSNLTLRRSMNGDTYTYVKSSNNRKLKYTFSLDRYKAIELEEFFRAYNAASIKMMNWKGEIWNVKLLTNPIDFVQVRRAEPGGDRTDVNLEFEGVKISG
jgi:hypothetical protein